MKNLILGLSLILLLPNVYSQTEESPISIQKKKYYQNGQMLKNPDLKAILSTNTFSATEYKLFKKNSNIASPFIIVGGICVAAAGVTILTSSIKEAEDVNNGELCNDYPSGLGFAIVGLSCVIVSIPFSLSAKTHLNNSVDLYNSNIKDTGSIPVEFNFIVNANGLGVRMRF